MCEITDAANPSIIKRFNIISRKASLTSQKFRIFIIFIFFPFNFSYKHIVAMSTNSHFTITLNTDIFYDAV